MEFRYVYRRIEDDIGSPLKIKESPHANLTRQLRFAFRECKDAAHKTEMVALCMASMSGNQSLDVVQMSDRIMDMLDDAMDQRIPYIGAARSGRAKTDRMEEYFKELDELEKELKAKKESEVSSDAKQMSDTLKSDIIGQRQV